MSPYSLLAPKTISLIAFILCVFLSQISIAQQLEGNIWRVTDDTKPYPKGNYWDFWLLSDSTYVIQDRYSKNYKVQVGIKRMELPGHDGTFPFELKNDELHIQSQKTKMDWKIT
jgi:hypothetical protein